MPRKRPAPAEDDENKQQKTEGSDDWRAPLFFWHGKVTTDIDTEVTTWQGTWLASEDGLPSAADFKTAENTFKLTSCDFLPRDGVRLEDVCPFGRSGYWGGTFTLDKGDGFKDVSDIEHRIVCLLG